MKNSTINSSLKVTSFITSKANKIKLLFLAAILCCIYNNGFAQTTIYANHFTNTTFPAPAAITGASSDDILEQDGAGHQWARSTGGGNLDAPCMTYTFLGASPANCWYITGGLSLTAGTTYLVTVFYEAAATWPEQFNVTYGTTQTGAGQTTLLGTVNVANSTYLSNVYAITPSTTGTYYVGFNCISAKNQDVLTLDDITVTSVSSCGNTYYTTPSAVAQPYTVPTGVSSVRINIGGGTGAPNVNRGSIAEPPGIGGAVVCTLSVAGIPSINAYVGGNGTAGNDINGGTGGIGIDPGGNGGNSANQGGGGGGGASEIRVTTGSTPLIVAAGGGGSGGNFNAGLLNGYGGAGGPSGSPGAQGASFGGGGATISGPGIAGIGANAGAANGLPGVGGTGGAGADVSVTGGAAGGGGGGGGYFGGGGGGGGNAKGDGGGGGGSNYAAGAGVSGVSTNGASTQGNGYVIITPLAPTAFAMTGGGAGCTSPGVAVGLANSQNNVQYQLYTGATAVGSPVTGNGSAISFGNISTAGTYTVAAYYPGYPGCLTEMSGSEIVSITANPTITIGASPSLNIGTTSAPLPYTGTTGTPTTYSITWDATAHGQLFNDALSQPMPGSSPIVLTIPSGPAAATYNGTITVTNSGGCASAPVAFTVTVTSASTPPTITLGASPAVCSGTPSVSLPYTATTGSPTTYDITWDATAHGQLFADALNQVIPLSSPINFSIPPGATPAVYNGTITVKNAFLLTSTPQAFTVTIIALPDVSNFATATATICAGNLSTVTITSSTLVNGTSYSVNYTLSGTSGNSGTFNAPMTFGAGTGTFSIVSGNIPNPGATTVAINSITNTTTLCSNNPSSGNTANFTVNPLATVTLGASPSVETGTTTANLPYTATTGTPTTYSIFWSAAALGQTFTNVTNQPVPASSPIVIAVPPGAAVASYTGTITVTNATLCTSTPVVFTLTVTNVVSSVSLCTRQYTTPTSSAFVYNIPLGVTSVSVSMQGGNGGASGNGTPTPALGGNGGAVTCNLAVSGGTSLNVFVGGQGANGVLGGVVSGIKAGGVGGAGIAAGGNGGTAAAGTGVSGAGGGGASGIRDGLGNVLIVAAGGGGANGGNSTIFSGGAGGANGTTGNAGGAATGGHGGNSGGPNANGGTGGAAGGLGTSTSGGVGGNGGNLGGGAGGGGYYSGGGGAGGTLASANMSAGGGGANYVGGAGVSSVTTNGTAGTTGNGFVNITILSTPTLFSVTAPGGVTGCANIGVDIMLSGSELGVNYQLYTGASAVGSVWIGDGGSHDFGNQLTSGTYSVQAYYTGYPACITTMTGSPVVAINPLPTIGFSSTTATATCPGSNGTLIYNITTNSPTSYTIYWDGTAQGQGFPASSTGTVSGTTGSITVPIPSGAAASAGYTGTVTVTNANSCISSGGTGITIPVISAPALQTVTGGGELCSGGTGFPIGLSASQGGVQYTLGDATGAVIATGAPGAGGAFNLVSAETAAGTYTITASYVTTPACPTLMTGNAVITVDPVPVVTSFATTATSSCLGNASTVTITSSTLLTGTTYTVNYTLSGAAGNAGTFNASMIYGSGTGSFSIPAIQLLNGGATTVTINSITEGVCPATVSVGNTANFSVNVLSSPTPITNNSPMCTGGSTITLNDASSGGVWSGGVAGVATVNNSTGVVTPGTTPGTATIVYSTGCGSDASTTVTVNAPPSLITNGAPLCTSGSAITLSDASTGGTWSGGAPGVATVDVNTGVVTTGTLPGNTTINYSNGCGVAASITLTVSASPVRFLVTGGGTFCGTTGANVNLSSSTIGISYQLYNGALVVGPPVIGTGTALGFGLQTTSGNYTVIANNATTGCSIAMTGSATVTANALPALYTISSGGSYCAGSTGIDLSLSGSDLGVSYQLYIGSTPTGTAATGSGTILDFGIRTVAGTYTIIANNNVTGCSIGMNGSAVIAVNPLPAVFTVTGGGNYCAGGSGVHIGLSNSTTGVNYQLYFGAVATGSSVAGNGAAIDFGLVSAVGTYTVLATDAITGCTKVMNGSAFVGINSLPTAYAVTGGGSYCAGGPGVDITLSSSDLGVSYQLYNGASPSGAAMPGTSGSVDFGFRTAAGGYTVIATTIANACTNNMTGIVAVSVNPLPAAYVVTGGGSYCSGTGGEPVNLNGSDVGVNYQLYNGLGAVGTTIAGSGTGFSFGMETVGGTYSVVASNAVSGCTKNMSGNPTVIMNATPAVFTVTGGGSYCAGGTGLNIGLSSSGLGTGYQLYNGSSPVGGLVPGTGGSLDFGPQTAGGTYSITAVNSPSGCMSNMTGSASVVVNALPVVYGITGGGGYCAGGTGVDIMLSNSQAGVNYQLYNNGSAVGSALAGTNNYIDFGIQLAAGTYTISAVNAGNICSSPMSGNAVVTINPLPAVYSVTGGGGYCAGGVGVHVGLSGSNTGINYKLYNGFTLTGSTGGTGAAIDFGLETAAGTYTVLAADAITGCTSNMSGSKVITIDALPGVHNVTGSGSYCAGGTGVAIGLDGSESGIKYQLYYGSSPVGGLVTGAGSTVTFGQQLSAGTYSVSAVNQPTGCTSNMYGGAAVVINSLPVVYTVIGGGNYCAGGTPLDIALSGSTPTDHYQLFNGSTPLSILSGNGGVLDFGLQPAGSYTIVATNPASCTSNMSGTAVVTMSPLPTVHNVTGGGDYCAGGIGLNIGLDGSDAGINYQLFNGSAPVGSAITGTGSAFNFGLQTAAGNYKVVAANIATGCTNNMTNNPAIVVDPKPVVYNVTGGGGYCFGTPGADITLSNSENGITYHLYNGAAAVVSFLGNGLALDFGQQPTGLYTVVAENIPTGCKSNMNDTVAVSLNPLPTAYAVSGGGSYCAGGTGVHVGLNGSAIGISYQLYHGTSSVGSSLAGTGSALDFGLQTAAGTYTVLATNTGTGCTNNMTGSQIVSINLLPSVYNVHGGGSYCSGGIGVDISLGGSDAGIFYQLFNGSTSVGPTQSGAGGVDFGLQTASGTYHVVATDMTSNCISNMSGSAVVNINPLPIAYMVHSSINAYCAGGPGIDVTLSHSTVGVRYQLYNGGSTTGATVFGNGTVLDFGMQLAPGTYTAIGTDTATGCANSMSSFTTITVNPPPLVYNVTGGGAYCSLGTGVHVGLSGSDAGFRYDLYNGSVFVNSTLGTGGIVDFGLQTTTGTYIVMATNISTACTSNMNGSAIVTTNALPTAYTVAGGGNYCSGGIGANVSLAGSDTGVTYQLYTGGVAVGAAMAGSGSTINFGLHTSPGVYTIQGTNNTTGCISTMNGTATIGILPLPANYTVTGGGSYCAGGTGVNVGLSGSTSGVHYQLYDGLTSIGGYVTGTGSAIGFGSQAAAGSYSVVATDPITGCVSPMGSSVSVAVNPLPTVYNVTGGGSYCAGTTGVPVGISGSQTGVSYQLLIGSSTSGSAINGTGSAVGFGALTAPGTYTAYAMNTITNCTVNMDGYAQVVVNPTVVPSITLMATPGDTVCAGTDVSFAILTANGGTSPSYQWTVNTTNVSVLNNYNYIPSNGDVVTVTMTSSQACATPATVSASQAIVVNAHVTPAVTISSDHGDTVCRGTSVIFTASPVYGGTPVYSWLLNGANVGGGAVYSFVPSSGDVIECEMASDYICRTADLVFSAPVTMQVDTALSPSVNITVNPGTMIAQGQLDTLLAIVTNGGQSPAYQWFINGSAVRGATHSVFVNGNFHDGDSVTCEVTSSGMCGSLSSFNSVIIHIQGTGVTTVHGGNGNVILLPNPNKGDFMLKGALSTTTDEDVSIEITDVLGQVVYHSKVIARNGAINEQIKLKNTLANGMYLLNMQSATDHQVFHFVIEQ